jgi:hypothetical protein
MFIFTDEELGQKTNTEAEPEQETLNLDFTSPTIYRQDGTEVKAKDAKYLFQERPTLGEFTKKMFGAGVDQVQGLGMGFVGLAGDLAGVESVKKLGLEGFNDNMREAGMAREEAGMVDFTDIEGVGDAAKWAYGTLLEQAPQLIPTIALGGAGGLAGKQFAKGVVQSAVQKAIANGLTEKAAAVTVANAVASRGGMKYAAKRLMEGGLTREAAEGALGQVATARIAPIAGAAAGNLATGVGMMTGSIYGDTEDAGLALKYGIPAGAIEGFTDTLIGSPFIRRAFGVNVAKNTAEGSLLKEVGKGVAKGVALEGPAEELPQTYLEQLAKLEKDPNYYGPGGINSEQAKRERINATAAGSFIGGTMGGAGGVVERLAPVTANALKGLTQKPLEDPEVPDAGAPSGDIVYDKDSVTLDGGLVMRRWNVAETGDTGWVVENAQQDVFDKLANARGGIVQDGKLFVFPNTQEGASLFDRAETAAAKARGEIVDEDGDGIDDREQGKTDDSDLTALDLSGNESVIQAKKQNETKKAVVEAGIPADAVDELVKDLRDSGVDEENIVEAAKATAAALPAKKQSEIPPPPAPILTDSTPIEEIDKEIASRRDLLETTTFGAEGDKALEDSIKQLEEAKTAKVESVKTPQVSDKINPEDAGSTPAPATPEVTETQSEIAELNDEGAVDEDEYEDDSDEDEELEPNAVDTKLEQLQAKHKAKIEADKEEQRKLLESRTPEQQQAIVDSFTPGQIITNGVTTGAFVEKTEDGGIVVAQKGKKQKMSPATVQNVTTATATDPEPTRNDALVTVLGSADAPNLEAAGLTPTGEADEDGGKILEEKRRDALFPKQPFTVVTKLFKKQDGSLVSRSYHEYDPTRTTKQTEATKRISKRNMLRALDQGVEVRIPNGVEVPAGVSVVPAEGKNYSLVDSVEYDEDGVNLGVFKASDLAARTGSFADAYNSNPALQKIKLERSNQNRNVRAANNTDALSSTAKSASEMTPAAQSVLEKIAKNWLQSVDSYISSEPMSGVGQQGVEYFKDTATNKVIKAVSKAFEGEQGDPAIVAKVTDLFVSGEEPSKIPKLALEGRPQNKEETALVNRTVKKLKGIQAFALPKKHLGPLKQVASDTFKYDKLRKDEVSLDAPNDGGTTLGDKLSEDDQAVSANNQFTENATPYTAQQDEDAGDSEAPAMEQGELSKEEAKTLEEQEKENAKIVNSIGNIDEALKDFQNSLSPLEKIAYDFLAISDKKTKDKLYGQLEDRIEDPDGFIQDIEEKTAKFIRDSSGLSPGKTFSPAASSKRKQSIGAEPTGTTLGRKPSSPKLQRIKRRFLQAKVGLSDEQMVGMSNAEVDRAYLAYNSRADENKAAAAQDAVVSVAPGIERLVELGDQELVGAYADAILAAEKEGDYGKLRDLNFNELVRFGAFESTRELLTRLADPKNKAPRDMRVRAKAFLEMEKRGLKLDNIEVQAANFLKTGTKDRAVWGGLLGRNADYSAFGVYINLDQAHDRETPLQTVLHELAHVATFAKVHGKVKTTAQEDRIIKDLERMRRAAILKAGNASPAMKAAADKAGATTPEARLANYEKALKAMIASGEEGSRRYNGLQNLDEFIVEMTGSPDFVQLLSQLGFGAVNADKRTFNGMIRDAFNAILKLIGVNISPSSELGKAFMDSWNFTFRGTKYKAAPSELLKAVRGVAEAKAEPKTAAKAAKSQSDKSSIPAPQGEAEVKPEGNNQVTKPTAKKAKRAKAGRPTNREIREATALPKTEEEIAAEKAALEKLLEQESKMEGEEAPQSPAADKFNREVMSGGARRVIRPAAKTETKSPETRIIAGKKYFRDADGMWKLGSGVAKQVSSVTLFSNYLLEIARMMFLKYLNLIQKLLLTKLVQV